MVHWKNVATFVWCARATGPSARAGVEFAGELSREYPQFSVLHVVEESAGLPTPEGREELVAVARRTKQAVACFGLLLPKSGVLATLLRAFVRGVRTVLRVPLEVMIDDDLAELTSLRNGASAPDGCTLHGLRASERSPGSTQARAR